MGAVKRGILITVSYTPPRLSTIEWVEERRAVVLVTKQDGVDQTHMTEPARRRPKNAIIPWDGDEKTLAGWQQRVEYIVEEYAKYTRMVSNLKDEVVEYHIPYPEKAPKGGKR